MSDRITPSGVAIGRQANLQTMQARLAQATAELSSGRRADPAGNAGLGASLLYRLHDRMAQGEALNEAIGLAGKRFETMQTALDAVSTTITQLSTAALQSDALDGASWKVLAGQARGSMAGMVDQLNASFDGQHLFGGTDSDGPPLLPPEAPGGMLDQVRARIGALGPVDGANAASFIADIEATFAAAYNGTMYASVSTTGDGKPSSVRIGAGETMDYDVRADAPAMRKTFLATSMLSLLDAPDADLAPAAKAALAKRAGTLLRDAHGAVTDMAGLLGAKQQRLERVAEIQAGTMTAAASQINAMEATDYAATADRVSQLQLQLQATYAVTAKLADLSLVNYLR